ncbi:MAG TPA: hypothetical protein VEC17_02690 [Candidatus Binatia bacterium]|nr:hypothetical protein [Candidatus Binatia bacterium]
MQDYLIYPERDSENGAQLLTDPEANLQAPVRIKAASLIEAAMISRSIAQSQHMGKNVRLEPVLPRILR